MAATVYQMRVAKSEEDEVCCNCGVEFASPVIAIRRNDGKSFYCPNGHSQSYRETEATKLQKQLDQERQKREQAERETEWAKAEARTARTQETKAKNKLKKVVTRVNAGVCPHCNRTFQQLARHMQSKHSVCEHGDES
jgi:ATPase subunit of ABC transporter with duplicated ATPase domains